jgi:hypothetical protein
MVSAAHVDKQASDDGLTVHVSMHLSIYLSIYLMPDHAIDALTQAEDHSCQTKDMHDPGWCIHQLWRSMHGRLAPKRHFMYAEFGAKIYLVIRANLLMIDIDCQ